MYRIAILAGVALASVSCAAETPVGIFENHADIGTVLHAGSARYAESTKTYTLTGSGDNMWAAQDAFHFAWMKVTGDVSLAADISLVGAGTAPHRKAVLMFRQSLDADSAYADAAVHGDGLTSLQFRDAKGAKTHEVQANVTAPARVRLVRRGKYVQLYLAGRGEELRFSGAAVPLSFVGPVYVGIGVCSHNKDATETATFANVELTTNLPAAKAFHSTLETQAMNSTDRRVVFVTPTRIEAPNWLRDGRTLIYNGGGRLYRIRRPAGLRRLSTPALRSGATTITASRRTAAGSSSATSRRATESRASIPCRSPAVCRSWSRPTRRPTGTGGRPMGKHWRIVPSGMANSTFTASRLAAAGKRG